MRSKAVHGNTVLAEIRSEGVLFGGKYRGSRRRTGLGRFCYIVWEFEAETQLVANMAKGHQVAPYGLVDAGEGTRILFLSYYKGTFNYMCACSVKRLWVDR